MAEPLRTPLEEQQLAQAGSLLGTFWHRTRSSIVTSELRRAKVGVVADIGAGAGHFGNWLQVNAPEVEYRFYEPLDSVRTELSRRFGRDRELSSSTDLTGVDAVVMLDVLEHIDDDYGELRSVVCRMAPGALFIATVPALPALHSAWDDALGHFRRHTRGSLNRLAMAAGLDVRSCSYLFPELLVPALARKVLRRSSTSAEFPDLPEWLDQSAYHLARATSRFYPRWPAGTSLMLVASVRR